MALTEVRDAPATRNAAKSRQRILDAAETVFATRGLEGTRMAAIADLAGCNQALLYHYFASKDDLFTAVLEQTYAKIRAAEQKLELDDLQPMAAMQKLVEFSFDYVRDNPSFIKLINDENMHGAEHLKASDEARQLNTPLVDTIATILQAGVASGDFRNGVDPVQLYITIASLAYFFTSNRATLSVIFDLPDAKACFALRRAHIVEVVLGYLRTSRVT
ncbi:MAG: TetR family transcriptional regulator [Rhizobiales bacterium]|nr:TetR family transcriptional regulator [Hyphomicrobiales bacterium]MBO6698590.1 TetR family transcriptional regulator [Hyphomicrobiales bacterium]MBO6735157.1 TetR family transcriptional regulator [Hyphomicrobiales bacterium]MBO6911036.1 TetR family transcriptional regulator [Hyphomicrobiales bacterium]MBO6956453.1 TetR family transcriptional regulator [Hyphomicrobiales bacterium]